MDKPRQYHRWLFLLAVLGFAADQVTKYAAFRGLYEPGQITGAREVVPGAFRLLVQFDPSADPPHDNVLTRLNGELPPRVNHGALFSLGARYKDRANQFYTWISLAAAIGILVWATRPTTKSDRWLCIALGLILGGTFGNFYDRLLFGGVRDFLYFYLIEWPIFNVADCGLVCGAIMMLLQAIFGRPQTASAAAGASAAGPAAGVPSDLSPSTPPGGAPTLGTAGPTTSLPSSAPTSNP